MTLSSEELTSMLNKNPGLRKRNPGLAKSLCGSSETSRKDLKDPKYRNQKVFVYEDHFVSVGEKADGHGKAIEKYDSVKEYRRYQELQLLQRAGAISDLRRQVELVIQEPFEYGGKKIRGVTYVADHIYVLNGETVVEDVKGVGKDGHTVTATKDFKLKWKLLMARYPDFVFEVY